MSRFDPNWDDLKLFLEVSRFPRLSDASRRLGIDATTVSRRLRRLETDLGSILFERTPRGHVLTPAGQQLSNRVEQLEQMTTSIAADISGEGERASGRVKLGVTEGFGAAMVAPAIHEFIQLYPRIEIDLISTNGYVSVSKREADMSVLLSRPTTGRLKARKLADYMVYLYASPGFLEQNGRPTNRADIDDMPFIGYVEDLLMSSKQRYHTEVRPNLEPRFCSSSLIAQYQMARNGCGLVALPAFMADEDKSMEIVLPDKVQIRRSLWLATHEDIADLARIKAVSEFLQELVSRERGRMMGHIATQI